MSALIRPSDGLTFDDVLLVPKGSQVRSRGEVSTATCLTRSLPLAIPLVSANMDTVTEANMAIAMARAGGIGVIHRFMPAERQAVEVARVKRAESFVVEEPVLISPTDTVSLARSLMAANNIGGLAVVDYTAMLVGLVTTRDVLFAPDETAPVSSVMTPRERLITLGALAFLTAVRPGLLEEDSSSVDSRWVWIGGLAMAVLLAVLTPLASSHPDGLMRFAEQTGFLTSAQKPAYELIPKYIIPGITNTGLSTILAGILGVMLVFGAALLISRIRRKKRNG